MDPDQIIYDAFYKVVRQVPQPTKEKFFELSIADSMGQIQGPESRPDLWWETLELQIQAGFLQEQEGYWIRNFNYQWLKAEAAKSTKWSEARDYINDNLGPAT
jgi:hypothetical protein